MKQQQIIIFGTGEIAELADFYFTHDSEFEVAGFTVDGAYLKQTEFRGRPVVAFEQVIERFPPDNCGIFVAVSYAKINAVRAEKVAAARTKGYRIATYLSSRATVFPGFAPQENCFILEDNTIQPFASIGANVTLWSGNHIGHHSIIEDDVFLASQVVVSGGVRIGQGSFVGVNVTIRDHVTIGKKCVLGAGALVLEDQPDYSGRRAAGVGTVAGAQHPTSEFVRTRMSWRRFGVVFAPDGKQPWARSHAALPVPVHIAEDIFRFFYSSRDAERRSHVGWVDVEVSERPLIRDVASEPVLSPGIDGTFDDSGVGIGCITEADGGFRALLYGMESRRALAVAQRDRRCAMAEMPQGRVRAFFGGPDPRSLARRSLHAVISVRASVRSAGLADVVRLESCAGRRQCRYAARHQRPLRRATAFTGRGTALIVVGFATPSEYALARPSVVKVGDGLLMCFACRGDKYRTRRCIER